MTLEDRRAEDARRRGGRLRAARLERQGHEPRSCFAATRRATRLQKDNVLLAWTQRRHADAHGNRSRSIRPRSPSFPAGMVISEFTAPRWSTDGARLLVGLKEQEPEAPASTEPQANVDVWHWKDDDPQSVQIDPRQSGSARDATRRLSISPPAPSARSPTTTCARSRRRAICDGRIGRVDTPYRGQIAWGGSKARLLSREPRDRRARRSSSRASSRTMGVSPDGKWFLYLQEGPRLFVRDGDRQEDRDRRRPRASSTPKTITTTRSRSTASPDSPPTASPCCSTTATTCGRCRSSAARRSTSRKGVGAKQETRFRVARLGAGATRRRRGRRRRARPSISTKPITLSAYGECTKKSGYFALAPGQAPVAAHLGRQGDRHAHRRAQDADRMIFTQQTFNEYPNYWVADTRFAIAAAGHRRRSRAAQGVRVGHEEADRLHEQQGPAAAGDADAAGRLRAGQAVSDARVLLRDHVEHASQLPDSAVRRSAAHVDVREQRLSRAAAGRRLRDRQAGIVGARLRRQRGEEGDRARLRGSEARRPAGPQLGRLPVVVHRHADRHVRRGRHRRAADRPHQLLRHAVPIDRQHPAGHHRSRPGAHGRRT